MENGREDYIVGNRTQCYRIFKTLYLVEHMRNLKLIGNFILIHQLKYILIAYSNKRKYNILVIVDVEKQ